jgi:hypothetical protein
LDDGSAETEAQPRRHAVSLLGGALVTLGAALTCFGGWIAALEFTTSYHDSDYFSLGAIVIVVGCSGMGLGYAAVVTARSGARRRFFAVGIAALASMATGLGAAARALWG